MRLCYAELTSVCVTKTVQLIISDCDNWDINIPKHADIFLEIGKVDTIVHTDADFLHREAWCYPYEKFRISEENEDGSWASTPAGSGGAWFVTNSYDSTEHITVPERTYE